MKFILNFFRIIFSLIISFVLTAVLFSTCLIQPLSEMVQPDKIAEKTEVIMDGVIDELKNNPDGEIANLINSVIGETGISTETFGQILENQGVKEMAGEFMETLVNKTTGIDANAQYPDKEEVVDMINENLDDLSALVGDNADEISREDITKLVDANYDQCISMLDQLAEMLGGSTEVKGEQ